MGCIWKKNKTWEIFYEHKLADNKVYANIILQTSNGYESNILVNNQKVLSRVKTVLYWFERKIYIIAVGLVLLYRHV